MNVALISATWKFTSSWSTVRVVIFSRLSSAACALSNTSRRTLSGRYFRRSSQACITVIAALRQLRSTVESTSSRRKRQEIRRELLNAFCTEIWNQATSSSTLIRTPSWVTLVWHESSTMVPCMLRQTLAHPITWAPSKSTSSSMTRKVTSGHLVAWRMRWQL